MAGKALERQVALVTGGGKRGGRSIALALGSGRGGGHCVAACVGGRGGGGELHGVEGRGGAAYEGNSGWRAAGDCGGRGRQPARRRSKIISCGGKRIRAAGHTGEQRGHFFSCKV